MSQESRARLLRATVILAVLFAGVAASSIVEKPVSVGISALSGEALEDAENLLDSCESSSLPDGFEQEVLCLRDARKCYVDEAHGIVCFVVEGTASKVVESMSGELVNKGWNKVGGGIEECVSFAKDDGSYRWLLIQCSQMGGETCVVIWTR